MKNILVVQVLFCQKINHTGAGLLTCCHLLLSYVLLKADEKRKGEGLVWLSYGKRQKLLVTAWHRSGDLPQMGKEEQLIAQKKSPTPEESFVKANEWKEKQKAEQSSVASNNNSQTTNTINTKSTDKTSKGSLTDRDEEKRFKAMKTDVVNRLKQLYQSFLALDNTSYNGNVQCLDACKAFAYAYKEYLSFMNTSGYTTEKYPFRSNWVKVYHKWENFLNNELKVREDLEKFLAKLAKGLEYSEYQLKRTEKPTSFSNKLESTDYYFRKRIQGFIEMYEYYYWLASKISMQAGFTILGIVSSLVGIAHVIIAIFTKQKTKTLFWQCPAGRKDRGWFRRSAAKTF